MLSISGVARHTLGISLLLLTVLFWTASSFLASTIFADDTYSKPYLITYVNSFFFALLLPFDLVQRLGGRAWSTLTRRAGYVPLAGAEEDDQATFKPGDEVPRASSRHRSGRQGAPHRPSSNSRSPGKPSVIIPEPVLNVRQTAKLGFEFSVLWFAVMANYFAAACLGFTSVASSTILTSTSSIWTLIFGAFYGVERFTFRKLLGVLLSFAGMLLTSSVDISENHDENRGLFPHKSPGQIALGDALALASAVLYGIYATTMKRKIGNEARVNMSLFFGFVGLFGLIILLPGFPLLHLTGIERFQLPSSRRVVTIILVQNVARMHSLQADENRQINAVISLVSDIAWAYAMLLTSPLVVTVGLSLTIPLSLVGQVVINAQKSSAVYWIGAVVVLMSFLLVNYGSREEADHSRSKKDLDRSAIDHDHEGGVL